MRILTLMTDFGIKDGNVGVMKGVILGIAPGVHIVDISHTIAPQNVREAGLILARTVPYFPDGSIHAVVVDPGVGTARRAIAASIGSQYFVLPDNGILSMVLDRAEKLGQSCRFIHLDNPAYWRAEVSNVFHGRDIFAPAAAHLAAGVPLDKLGSEISDPVVIALPQPVRTEQGWTGEIIHVDHFGNLSANILREHLGKTNGWVVNITGVRIDGLVHTFGERPPNSLVALTGSNGNLVISVVNGSAAERLGVSVGERIELTLKDEALSLRLG